MATSEDKPITEVPVANHINDASRTLGYDENENVVVFPLSLLTRNRIGDFKTTDPAPAPPLFNQYYDLVGTGANGANPSGTYTNLLRAAATPIVIPAPAAGNGIFEARAFWDGAFFQPRWQEKPLPVQDLSGYATVANLATKVGFTDIYSKNLVNPNAAGVALGKFLAGNGVLTSSASYNTTDFIPVTAGVAMSASAGVRFIEFYSAKNSANYIGSVTSVSPPATSTNTPPAGATYARYTFLVSNWPKVQVEVGPSSTTVVGYGVVVNDNSVGTNAMQDLAVTGDKIKDATIPAGKMPFLIQQTNLIDIAASDVELGKILSSTTPGATSANASFNTTGKIYLIPGTTYQIGASPRVINYYDKNDAFISTVATSNPFPPVAITPAVGVAYVRISFSASGTAWSLATMNSGSTLLPWTKFGWATDHTILLTANTPIQGTSEGDSITAGVNGLYQTKIGSSLNISWTNTGVPGSKMGGTNADSMWQDARVNVLPTTTQILTVLCGTNDWSQSEPIGTMSRTNVDTTTFIGAYNVWLSKVYARILPVTPTLRVVLCTTTWGKRVGTLPGGWTDAYTNAVGLTCNDYAEAVRQFARMWNLEVIDFNLCWNSINMDIYIASIDGLHPNTTGLDRMSMKGIDKLKDLIRIN